MTLLMMIVTPHRHPRILMEPGISVYLFVHQPACLFIYVCVYMCTSVYICVYVCVLMCVLMCLIYLDVLD